MYVFTLYIEKAAMKRTDHFRMTIQAKKEKGEAEDAEQKPRLLSREC